MSDSKLTDAINTKLPKIDLWKVVTLLVVVVFLFTVALIAYVWHIPATDWNGYRNATIAMLHLQPNPSGMYSPPWIYIPLIPLALLPPAIGSAVVAILCYSVYWYVIRKLGADKIPALIFLSMPQIFFLSHNGSIDWLIPVGFILPPWIGLFFVMAKPQIGIGIAIYWGITSLREKGFWQTVKTFAPISIAYLLYILVYRPDFAHLTSGLPWDANVFPYGIPIGLFLLVVAIWKKEKGLSILASPFFA